jgi:hypothetical protein
MTNGCALNLGMVQPRERIKRAFLYREFGGELKPCLPSWCKADSSLPKQHDTIILTLRKEPVKICASLAALRLSSLVSSATRKPIRLAFRLVSRHPFLAREQRSSNQLRY